MANPVAPPEARAASYPLGDILTLRAFRPAIRDMRYPLEDRLDTNRHREMVVIGIGEQHPVKWLLTRTRVGWQSRMMEPSEDIADRPVVGVLGSEDVPYVGSIGRARRTEAQLAFMLASNPKSAGVEQVTDNTCQVQTVPIGTANGHVIWRVPAPKVKHLERFAGTAPVARITHGMASLLRLVIERFGSEKHPDIIICGDHSNFLWLDVISGQIQDMIRPGNCQTVQSFVEWVQGNLMQTHQMDRALQIDVYVSDFSWMKASPSIPTDPAVQVSINFQSVPLGDLVFA